MNKPETINKTMDKDDLDSEQLNGIVVELNNLVTELRNKGLRISSWYGTWKLQSLGYKIQGFPYGSVEKINRGYDYHKYLEDGDDENFPWFLYWEIAWIFSNGGFSNKDKVLDLGGSSSLFSYYLASKGMDVTTVDLQPNLVNNANHVAKQMNWQLANIVMDMKTIDFPSKFDHITSICVYEHLHTRDRLRTNERIRMLLRDGGRFSLTFDYLNPSQLANLSSQDDLYNQFILPTGFRLRGNQIFRDNGKRYLISPFYYRKRLWIYKIIYSLRREFPLSEFFRTRSSNDYTFGALFMENMLRE